MRPVRSGLQLRPQGESVLILETATGRRVWYLVIFLILFTAMVIGARDQNPFSDGKITGTLFYLLIMISSLGVFSWQKQVAWDTQNRTVRFTNRVLMIPIKDEKRDLDDCTGVLLLRHVLIRPSQLSGLGRKRHFTLLQNGSSLYRLYLMFGHRRIILDETTIDGKITEAGRTIAQFISRPFEMRES